MLFYDSIGLDFMLYGPHNYKYKMALLLIHMSYFSLFRFNICREWADELIIW